MTAGRTARRALAAALGLSALAASACVDEVVVGIQPNPITSLDAGADAQPPEPDAGSALDAQPPEPDAAAPDAAPPQTDAGAPDSSPPPSDAGADDGGPIFIVPFQDGGADAGCTAPDCTPDAGRLGPCFSCDVTILVSPDQRFGSCPAGLDELCWQNVDGTCSVQCPQNPTCRATADCAPDENCFFPRYDCGASGRGFCAPPPTISCETIGNPVCGCDDRRYENGCYALKAGVPIAADPYANCALDGGS